MDEWEKRGAGYLYNAVLDQEIVDKRLACADLCFALNSCRPSDIPKQQGFLKQILGRIGGYVVIRLPFWCDYGCNISLGDHFFSRGNLMILDAAPVTFGSHVFVGPNCVFTTAGHPIDRIHREQGLEVARPITVGNSVWIGASVTVLPGVEIGDTSIIGAGSVVTKSIPAGVIAFGNPCRVVRRITEADRNRYPVYVPGAEAGGAG